MRWLEPIDCRAAEECLREGQLLEAAKILLGSKDREHRCARRLLLRISPQLVEQAREAHQKDKSLAAAELIECAGRCAELDHEAQALRERILCECTEREKQDNWQNRRLQQAKDWAEDGRIHSALGLLEPVAEEPDARRLLADWQEDLRRFEGYVEQFEKLLADDQLDAAAAVLKKARAVARNQLQVLCMEKTLRQAMAESTEALHDELGHPVPDDQAAAEPPSPGLEPRPIANRSVSFALSGLSRYGSVLVVSQPVVSIGNHTSDWVQIPMHARIHRQHALLLREPDRENQRHRYRIVPYLGCEVLVQGRAVDDSCPLRDGDVVQLGNELCRWIFRQPVAGSATALLEQASGAAATIHTPDGGEFRTVVLAEESVIIGCTSVADDAHLVEPGLPAMRLRLRWHKDGLRAEIEDGTLFVDPDGDGPLTVPGSLSVFTDEDPMDLLRQAVSVDTPDMHTHMVFSIKDIGA